MHVCARASVVGGSGPSPPDCERLSRFRPAVNTGKRGKE